MTSSIKKRLKLLSHGTALTPSSGLTVTKSSGYCWACGTEGAWQLVNVINDELARVWQLTPPQRAAFDARESMFCQECHCSYRLRLMAEALAKQYNAKSLRELVGRSDFQSLAVAEINSCGVLHQFFEKLPKLAYSEYGSHDEDIPSENLEKLTYQDNTFDLVCTSDTLEHVPDVDKALDEIKRVLKPGGYHIFTVPMILSRETVVKASIDSAGSVLQMGEPAYHGSGEPDYMVFTEFGHDIIERLEGRGFSVKLFHLNPINLDDVSSLLITRKPV